MMGVTQLLLVGACCLLVKEALGLPTTMGGTAGSHAQHHDAHGQQQQQQQEPSDADKRSQEDIMFGNQQNKPAGMVDDLIVFPERKSSSAHANKEGSGTKPDKNTTHQQQAQEKAGGHTASGGDTSSGGAPEDEAPEQAPPGAADMEQQQSAGDLMGSPAGLQTGKFDYYDYSDDAGVSSAAATAATDSAERAPTPQDNGGELDYSLYDYGDVGVGGMGSGVFRRKRNLRNSLEELLRNRRIHRRALRLKRDANMDDLLLFLTQMAKQEPYPLFAEQEVPQVSRITLNPPEPESPLEQYLNELGTMNNEERARALVALAALADQEQLLPAPMTGRPVFEEQQAEPLPDWFQVNRRSRGSFYPQDYRYLVMPPTPQKRNVGADHWGRVLRQRRRQQRSQDQADVNRLYALAGLMAQPDQEDLWREP
ncbi:uncharacterized protein LOC119461019 [Dermacentor silvarum]|uniref:uncharacterized protein LOC119461019 n=1 Tax=Dermacentor silvarum TaxID=543639 RepID=UPI0018982E09|nr:uncharacterized protein LOC119461019 [Dermacentor silvarum]